MVQRSQNPALLCRLDRWKSVGRHNSLLRFKRYAHSSPISLTNWPTGALSPCVPADRWVRRVYPKSDLERFSACSPTVESQDGELVGEIFEEQPGRVREMVRPLRLGDGDVDLG
jgi:hypothetical protein